MSGDVLECAQSMTVIVMSTAGLVAIGLGARVLWRLGSRAKPTAGTPRDDERMQRLETAVDTIAIEVERISEAQRFLVSPLSGSLPARPAEHAGALEPPGREGRGVTAR